MPEENPQEYPQPTWQEKVRSHLPLLLSVVIILLVANLFLFVLQLIGTQNTNSLLKDCNVTKICSNYIGGVINGRGS